MNTAQLPRLWWRHALVSLPVFGIMLLVLPLVTVGINLQSSSDASPNGAFQIAFSTLAFEASHKTLVILVSIVILGSNFLAARFAGPVANSSRQWLGVVIGAIMFVLAVAFASVGSY